MGEHLGSRRALLRGGAVGIGALGASALAVGFSPDGAQAATVGPWNYVAPGESIQAAVTAGSRAIQLGDGTYSLTAPIMATAGLMIRGIGQRTRIVATAAMAEMIAIGNGGSVDAVTIGDLFLDCANLAQIGIDLNIVGTSGFYPKGEPDSVCRLDNLWVFNPVLDGVVYRGTDTQACVTTRVRVRHAGRYGFRVEAPDNWFHAAEATTKSTTGSSAGFYVGTAIAGSNGIGAGNNYFVACKAWYCYDFGWHVKGTRNLFIGSESQDTYNHGWFIEWDQNTFNSCVADTASAAALKAAKSFADGFYVADGCTQTQLIGCTSVDREPGGADAQQRYGFNVPASLVSAGMVVAQTGVNNVKGLTNVR